jgi:hypothetical protein
MHVAARENCASRRGHHRGRHLHPLHRASENVASQPGIEPGISCTAGEYSMKRAILTALFRCHSGSHLPPQYIDIEIQYNTEPAFYLVCSDE